PEKIAVTGGDGAGVGKNEIAGTVAEIGYRGEQSMLEVRTAAGVVLKVSVTNRRRRAADGPAVGESVRLIFAADDIVALTR
ncbi:MAG: TOBE domain-containing protein, partial [Variibacter sp.]